MNNTQTSLQVRQNETRLANTNEAKILLPILTEYANLYRGEIKDEATKKKNILVLANELSKVKINGRPAIEAASSSSIREVALKVITEDIDLSKKQAVLIPYGNDITLQKQFYGNVALAKQVFNNNIEFYSQLVYPGDEFEIIKNGNGFGRDKYEHTTSPKNMVQVVNGYKQAATPTFVYTYVIDLTTDKVIATNCFSFERCNTSWSQAGIKPTHKKFPGEMMIKTCESYLATRLYNKSNADNENQLTDEWEEPNKDDNSIEVDNFDTMPNVEPTPTPKPTPKQRVKKVEPQPAPDFDYDQPTVEYNSTIGEDTFDDGFDFTVEDTLQTTEINDFLADDVVEPVVKHGVPYRDYKDKWSQLGWRVISGTYDASTHLCDIEKVKK